MTLPYKLEPTPAAPVSATAPVLHCENVEKVYGSRGSTTKALNGISFSVNRGEYMAIMGASGSGKTTLLNCISSIDRASAGHIYVAGKDITTMKSKQLSKYRRDELGFIFQDSNVLDTLTAYENIALALTIQKVPPREIAMRVAAVAEHLSITEVLKKFPYQLSGGQKQRVAAARAIITNPSLVLADEPTGALDSKSAKMLLESFEMLNRNLQATILMVTHDSFAASYTKRVLFIQDGKLFTELVRGDMTRKAFFNRIIEVVSILGGEDNDVL
jgi:putative ABC transport system ATP-binding protein